jgi:hypothetical protein
VETDPSATRRGIAVRVKPWQYSILLLILCAAILGGLQWHRARQDFSDAALSRRLPEPKTGVKIYLDARRLRDTGMLDLLLGSKAAEELEYRSFVDEIAFDYREDLDSIVAMFDGNTSSFLLRGRFEWPRIREYAEAQGAVCRDGRCFWESRTPGNVLSFCPVARDVLSISISPNLWAAQGAMVLRPIPAGYHVPPDPFWVAIPGSSIYAARSLPPGANSVASALRAAVRVTIGIGAEGESFRAEMRAVFPEESDAQASLDRLTELTSTLRKFLARGKTVPNPGDLSGVLAGGSFARHSREVIGRWPLHRDFLTALSEDQI